MGGACAVQHRERGIVISGAVPNTSEIHGCNPSSWIFLAYARIDIDQGAKKRLRLRRFAQLQQNIAKIYASCRIIWRQDQDSSQHQIGRASCRERGVDLGGRRIIKKKKDEYATLSYT